MNNHSLTLCGRLNTRSATIFSRVEHDIKETFLTNKVTARVGGRRGCGEEPAVSDCRRLCLNTKRLGSRTFDSELTAKNRCVVRFLVMSCDVEVLAPPSLPHLCPQPVFSPHSLRLVLAERNVSLRIKWRFAIKYLPSSTFLTELVVS